FDARGRALSGRAAPSLPPGRTSAAGDVATIEGRDVVIRTADGRRVVLRGHTRQVMSVRFSADSAYVVTASRDRTARIWQTSPGTLLHALRGHYGVVDDASFSPDGHWVVTAGPGTAGLWSADSGERILWLRGHRGRLTSASFDASGDRILTAGVDGTIRVFDCDICRSGPALVAVAEERLAMTHRTLSPNERARFLH